MISLECRVSNGILSPPPPITSSSFSYLLLLLLHLFRKRERKRERESETEREREREREREKERKSLSLVLSLPPSLSLPRLSLPPALPLSRVLLPTERDLDVSSLIGVPRQTTIAKAENKTHIDVKQCREGYARTVHTMVQPMQGVGSAQYVLVRRTSLCAERTEKGLDETW